MALTQTKTPYEFLARWDDAGLLKGTHLVNRIAILEDGVEIRSWYEDAKPVALTDAALLGTISGQINVAALADNDAKTVALKAAQADIADKAAQIEQLTAAAESAAVAAAKL